MKVGGWGRGVEREGWALAHFVYLLVRVTCV